jgi:hypothetical protein
LSDNDHVTIWSHLRKFAAKIKYMKKFILSIGLVGVAAASNAQVAFGPEVGLNSVNMTLKDTAASALSTGGAKLSFTVGGVAEFGLSDNFYLQPGVFYVRNGFKSSVFGITMDMVVNTIQIPINVEYKFGKPGGNRVFVGAGPYIGMNLGGTMSLKGNVFGFPISETQSVKIGSDTSAAVKPIDAGFGLNAGYQLSNGMFIRVHYQMGLANLRPEGTSDVSVKTSNVGISVGYLFETKKKGKTTANAEKK